MAMRHYEKPSQSSRQTTEQIRAQQAWEVIQEIELENQALEKRDQFHHNYGTLARQLPTMIQINGLATTLAFLLAKAKSGSAEKKEYRRIYQHLEKRIGYYFHKQDWAEEPDDEPEDELFELMDFVRITSTNQYRRASAEAVTFALWLRRYVEAKNWKGSES